MTARSGYSCDRMGPLDALPWRNLARHGRSRLAGPGVNLCRGPDRSPTAPAPAAPADRGRFAALWVTPVAHTSIPGAGVEGGDRVSLAGRARPLRFLQNGYAPPERSDAGAHPRALQRQLPGPGIGGAHDGLHIASPTVTTRRIRATRRASAIRSHPVERPPARVDGRPTGRRPRMTHGPTYVTRDAQGVTRPHRKADALIVTYTNRCLLVDITGARAFSCRKACNFGNSPARATASQSVTVLTRSRCDHADAVNTSGISAGNRIACGASSSRADRASATADRARSRTSRSRRARSRGGRGPSRRGRSSRR